jgi:hypothetical protein
MHIKSTLDIYISSYHVRPGAIHRYSDFSDLPSAFAYDNRMILDAIMPLRSEHNNYIISYQLHVSI